MADEKRKSLKRKSLIALIAYSLSFIAIIGTLTYLIVESPVRKELRENLDLRAQLLSTNIIEPLDSSLGILSAIVSVGEVNHSQEDQIKLLSKIFANINNEVVSGGLWPKPYLQDNNLVLDSLFFNRSADGKVDQVFSWNNLQSGGYGNEGWYKDVVNKPAHTVIWSPVYIDTYTHVQMITASAPYFINGEFAGVATVDLSLQKLVQFITEHAESYGLGILLKDQYDETIISHNFRVRDGSYVSSEKFGKFDWHIQVINADYLVMEKVYAIVAQIEYWLIPLLLAGVILGYYFISHNIITPIVEISKRVQDLKAGGLIEVPYKGRDELSYLVDAFNEKTIYLEQEKLKAQASTKAKSAFLATLSHEIRTPMNGILGNAQILLKSNLSNEQRQQLKQLYDSGQHMMELLNEILDFSKVEQGQFKLDVHTFVFSDLMDSVKNIYSSICHAKDLQLNIESGIAAEQALDADLSRIKQIVFNLVNNAVKFTPQGSIGVYFDLQEVNGEDFLHIRVTDTGIGISKDAQQKIFEPFQQAESSTTRRFGGTGLGLSIAKSLCELMKGRIELQSEVGKGTSFDVYVQVEKSNAKLIANESQAVEIYDYHGLSALVVEDNKTNEVIMTKFLTGMGFCCKSASNGLEALQQLEVDHYDLIMMDHHMPIMDGLTCINAIRTTPSDYRDILIIGCSADVYLESKQKMISTGADDVIAKPVEESELNKMLIKHKDKLVQYKGFELRKVQSYQFNAYLVEFCLAIENSEFNDALQQLELIIDLLGDSPTHNSLKQFCLEMKGKLQQSQLPTKDEIDRFTGLLTEFCM